MIIVLFQQLSLGVAGMSNHFKDLIGQYAPEIVVAAMTALTYAFVEALFSRRGRILYFLTDRAQVTIKRPQGNYLITTHSLVLQNVGRAVAEDVKIVHNWFPDYLEISPKMNHKKDELEGGGHAVILERVYPRQPVTITYLYFTPPQNIEIPSYVTAKDHLAKRIEVVFSWRYPRWALVCREILTLLGAGLVLYFAYQLSVPLLRMIAG